MTSKSTTSPAPFLAFVSDSKDLATLKAFAASQQWQEACIMQGDIGTAAQFLKANPSPALLLVQVASAAEAPAQLDGLAEVCDPATKVIVIGDVNEYSFYCWLTDIGIFSYLLKPLTEQALEQAYQKSQEKPQAAGPQERQPGKVMVVLGTRGGVGATTVALNLAGILAEQSKKSVALVDVDPQEGSIALTLDIEPSRGYREALEKPDRIDSLFIDRVVSKPHPHLSILSAEESLNERFPIHEQAGDTLLKALREKFDIVVLDLPRHLNVFARKCLATAEHVVLVTELSLLNLRDVLRTHDMMRDAMKMKPPHVVANRVGLAPKMEMKTADFEKGAGLKIEQRVVFAPELFMPSGPDIPALKMKTHEAIKPLYALAETLMPEMQGGSAKAKKAGFSLFGGKKKGGS